MSVAIAQLRWIESRNFRQDVAMTDRLRALQLAALAAAQEVLPGSTPRRVAVWDEHEVGILDLRIPLGELLAGLARLKQTAADDEDAAEASPGWDFTKKTPRFDGDPVPIAGRPLAVLKVLAHADGPVSVEELRRAAWDGYPASDSTVRGMVKTLREKLVTLWPTWEGDPVPATGSGWTLEIR